MKSNTFKFRDPKMQPGSTRNNKDSASKKMSINQSFTQNYVEKKATPGKDEPGSEGKKT